MSKSHCTCQVLPLRCCRLNYIYQHQIHLIRTPILLRLVSPVLVQSYDCSIVPDDVTNGSVSAWHTVYPKKYAHGFCFAVLCCGYTLTDFPISIRLTSLALWQSNDCPIASKATLMNMDKYFMLIHYERLHNHNKAKHNKTVCIFRGIYCIFILPRGRYWHVSCTVKIMATDFLVTEGVVVST